MNNKRNPAFRIAWAWLLLVLLLAIFRDVLANGRPLYCRIDGVNYYPGLRKIIQPENEPFGVAVLDSLLYNPVRWKTYPFERSLWAPIRFSPGEWLARPASNLATPASQHPELPDRFVHWLGTDDQGRDVAAGMISGARIALLTGALAMAMAFAIGLFLGSIAGYFADDGLAFRRSVLASSAAAFFVAIFWIAANWSAIVPGVDIWPLGFGILAIAGLAVLAKWALSKSHWGRLSVKIPADLIIMRLAEIFNAIPAIVVIIAVAAMLPRQSTWTMIGLIGAFSWTSVALFVRSELLRIRAMDYIAAVKGMGMHPLRILMRHALPNALSPTLVVLAFGTGSAIILEASLSFLGFGGVEFQGISWGSLMQNIVAHRTAWWLAIPPGMAVGLTVMALNTIGEQWNKMR